MYMTPNKWLFCLPISAINSRRDSQKADLILINTCSIREKAEQKAFSELGRLMKLKEENPKLIIGFAGCLAQHLGSESP